jgi:hypothetical protein
MTPQPLAIAAEAEDAALDRAINHNLCVDGLDKKLQAHRKAVRRTNRALRKLGMGRPNDRNAALSVWLGRPSAWIRCAQEFAKRIKEQEP